MDVMWKGGGMEEKQVQQPFREVSPQKCRAWEPTGRSPTTGNALRAATVLREGSLQSLARPADVLALGTLMGNSALSSLLTAARSPLVQPFSYRSPSGALNPIPVYTGAPALCEQLGFPDEPCGLEPFPAVFTEGRVWP